MRKIFGLSNREKEIVRLTAEGKAIKEIAKILHISPKTTQGHRMRIYNKLGLDGIANLTKYALKNGYTTLETDWFLHCTGCGQCCGPVPIDRYKWKYLSGKLQREPKFIKDYIGNTVLPITETGDCVFLTPEKTCAIYEERPEVCRLFGTIKELECPKKIL
jgi:DNA-binding CsgD family transcriptional regulator